MGKGIDMPMLVILLGAIGWMIMDGNGPIIGLVILDNHISKTETLSC